MLTAVIAPVAQTVVALTTGIAIDKAASLIIPPLMRPVSQVAVKVGVGIVSGVVATSIARYANKTIQSVVDTVTDTGAEEVTPDQEDN